MGSADFALRRKTASLPANLAAAGGAAMFSAPIGACEHTPRFLFFDALVWLENRRLCVHLMQNQWLVIKCHSCTNSKNLIFVPALRELVFASFVFDLCIFFFERAKIGELCPILFDHAWSVFSIDKVGGRFIDHFEGQ